MTLIALGIVITLDVLILVKLNQIVSLFQKSKRREKKVMALAQDILDAVAAESTVIDSVIEFIHQLESNETISPEQAQAILDAIAADKTKLEQAIINVPQP